MRPSLAVAVSVGALFVAGAATAGDRGGHDVYFASVATYQPMQGFNHIVGDKRFVGYFLAGKEACSVTVMVAMADDEALKTAPQRLQLSIPVADRAEIAAGAGRALAIACTVDADRIKVVALTNPLVKTAAN